MMALEDVLRETFESRGQSLPAVHDPAGRAIRRARAVRRRRGVLNAAAAVVCALALTGGLIVVQDWRTGGDASWDRYGNAVPGTTAPQPPAPKVKPGLGRQPAVDLFTDGYVWTTQGVRVSLVDPDWEVVRVYRVPAGWLLGGRTEARLVRPDNVTLPLPLGPHWAVSEDGTRVAYAVDGWLRVATLGANGLDQVAAAQVSADAVPVTFAGKRIVIGRPDGNGKLATIDEWQPPETYRPRAKALAVGLYETPTEEPLVQVPSAAGTGSVCLARLASGADGPRIGSSPVCGLEPAGGGWPAPVVSPDGRWLAMPAPSRVDLYAMDTLFVQRPAAVRSCDASATTGLIWESASAILATDGLTVVRCPVQGKVEPTALPVDLPSGWRFVPSRPPSGK